MAFGRRKGVATGPGTGVGTGTGTGRGGAGMGRGAASPFLGINFALYLISAILAGWALNRYFDRGIGGLGNRVTPTFLPIVLIACMVGLASCLAGAHHMRLFRSDSLAAAAATSLIAWLLVLLAMGLACKEIHTGGYRRKRLKVVEAFMIILALFELLYLLSLHLGFGRGNRNNGLGYNDGVATGTGTGIGMGGVGNNAGVGTGTGTGMGTGTGTTGVGGHNHDNHTDFGHHTDTRIPVGHVANPANPGY